MRMRIVRRGGAVGAVIAASLVLGVPPASATPGDGEAYAVEVAVTLPGAPAGKAGPLAPSNSGGPRVVSVAGVDAAGIVTAGPVTSESTLNEDTGGVHARAGLADVGIGLPALKGAIGAVNATCDATPAGTTGSASIANAELPGVSVPVNPAPNTTIALPSVTLVVNEQIRNPDGSLTVNGVHLEPDAPAGRGDIILAHARCGPAAPPVPLASGTGLWLGLGLLGLAAIPVTGMVIRKRRAATL